MSVQEHKRYARSEQVLIFTRPCGHALAHASKDGKKTLCGILISDIWAALDENTFQQERPCPECIGELKRVYRKGRQATLIEVAFMKEPTLPTSEKLLILR